MTGQQGGAMPPSRMMTGSREATTARPMTSVSGAGFNSNPKKGQAFDPLNAGAKGPAPPLASKAENSPEDMAKEMERKVNICVEESAEAAAMKDYELALQKAKDAVKQERQLSKHRENNNLVDSQNLELSGCVQFNFANAFHLNGMYEEAIQLYGMIVKNKQYPLSGRYRVNMGNIFYEQKKYPNAIRMYRMALDQIPNTQKEQKFKIMRNIGNAFVKLGQFQDAIQQFEAIMEVRC
jgi:intraflagellar transport protein 88